MINRYLHLHDLPRREREKVMLLLAAAADDEWTIQHDPRRQTLHIEWVLPRDHRVLSILPPSHPTMVGAAASGHRSAAREAYDGAPAVERHRAVRATTMSPTLQTREALSPASAPTRSPPTRGSGAGRAQQQVHRPGYARGPYDMTESDSDDLGIAPSVTAWPEASRPASPGWSAVATTTRYQCSTPLQRSRPPIDEGHEYSLPFEGTSPLLQSPDAFFDDDDVDGEDSRHLRDDHGYSRSPYSRSRRHGHSVTNRSRYPLSIDRSSFLSSQTQQRLEPQMQYDARTPVRSTTRNLLSPLVPSAQHATFTNLSGKDRGRRITSLGVHPEAMRCATLSDGAPPRAVLRSNSPRSRVAEAAIRRPTPNAGVGAGANRSRRGAVTPRSRSPTASRARTVQWTSHLLEDLMAFTATANFRGTAIRSVLQLTLDFLSIRVGNVQPVLSQQANELTALTAMFSEICSCCGTVQHFLSGVGEAGDGGPRTPVPFPRLPLTLTDFVVLCRLRHELLRDTVVVAQTRYSHSGQAEASASPSLSGVRHAYEASDTKKQRYGSATATRTERLSYYEAELEKQRRLLRDIVRSRGKRRDEVGSASTAEGEALHRYEGRALERMLEEQTKREQQLLEIIVALRAEDAVKERASWAPVSGALPVSHVYASDRARAGDSELRPLPGATASLPRGGGSRFLERHMVLRRYVPLQLLPRSLSRVLQTLRLAPNHVALIKARVGEWIELQGAVTDGAMNGDNADLPPHLMHGQVGGYGSPAHHIVYGSGAFDAEEHVDLYALLLVIVEAFALLRQGRTCRTEAPPVPPSTDGSAPRDGGAASSAASSVRRPAAPMASPGELEFREAVTALSAARAGRADGGASVAPCEEPRRRPWMTSAFEREEDVVLLEQLRREYHKPGATAPQGGGADGGRPVQTAAPVAPAAVPARAPVSVFYCPAGERYEVFRALEPAGGDEAPDHDAASLPSARSSHHSAAPFIWETDTPAASTAPTTRGDATGHSGGGDRRAEDGIASTASDTMPFVYSLEPHAAAVARNGSRGRPGSPLSARGAPGHHPPLAPSAVSERVSQSTPSSLASSVAPAPRSAPPPAAAHVAQTPPLLRDDRAPSAAPSADAATSTPWPSTSASPRSSSSTSRGASADAASAARKPQTPREYLAALASIEAQLLERRETLRGLPTDSSRATRSASASVDSARDAKLRDSQQPRSVGSTDTTARGSSALGRASDRYLEPDTEEDDGGRVSVDSDAAAELGEYTAVPSVPLGGGSAYTTTHNTTLRSFPSISPSITPLDVEEDLNDVSCESPSHPVRPSRYGSELEDLDSVTDPSTPPAVAAAFSGPPSRNASFDRVPLDRVGAPSSQVPEREPTRLSSSSVASNSASRATPSLMATPREGTHTPLLPSGIARLPVAAASEAVSVMDHSHFFGDTDTDAEVDAGALWDSSTAAEHFFDSVAPSVSSSHPRSGLLPSESGADALGGGIHVLNVGGSGTFAYESPWPGTGASLENTDAHRTAADDPSRASSSVLTDEEQNLLEGLERALKNIRKP